MPDATILGREEPETLSVRGRLIQPEDSKVAQYFEGQASRLPEFEQVLVREQQLESQRDVDRKSTRLNSSHRT